MLIFTSIFTDSEILSLTSHNYDLLAIEHSLQQHLGSGTI